MIKFFICAVIFLIFFLSPVREWLIWWIWQLFSRRQKVRAVLVSKVDSKFEDKVPRGWMMRDYARSKGKNDALNEAHWMRNPHKVTILIFDVAGRDVELAVNSDMFNRMNEGAIGILDYKGHIFYGFEECKQESVSERLSDRMGSYEYVKWLTQRKCNYRISRCIRHILIALVIIGIVIVRILVLNQTYAMHHNWDQYWITKKVEAKRDEEKKFNTKTLMERFLYLDKNHWYHIEISSLYHDINDGILVIHYDTLTGHVIPAIRESAWTAAYCVSGGIIIILVGRIIYLIIRMIKVNKARKNLIE